MFITYHPLNNTNIYWSESDAYILFENMENEILEYSTSFNRWMVFNTINPMED